MPTSARRFSLLFIRGDVGIAPYGFYFNLLVENKICEINCGLHFNQPFQNALYTKKLIYRKLYMSLIHKDKPTDMKPYQKC